MSEECPHKSCENSFETERGLKSHWGRMHDKIAPWKRHTCDWCGKVFEASPSHRTADESHCSMSCAEKNKEKNKNLITAECDNCGEKIQRYPSHIQEHNFCSRSCNGEWMSEIPVEEQPAYKGGGRDSAYGAKWRVARKKALDRDGCCTYEGCEKTECGNGYSLHVHHIKPSRKFDSLDEAHRLENLRTLCAVHHSEVEP